MKTANDIVQKRLVTIFDHLVANDSSSLCATERN